MPLRAISIIPLLVVAPRNIPIPTTSMMVFTVNTFAPIAEFRKLTASLLTPTMRSKIARPIRNTGKPQIKTLHAFEY